MSVGVDQNRDRAAGDGGNATGKGGTDAKVPEVLAMETNR
jgi:hypothetical protein